MMNTEVTGLIEETGRVAGVTARAKGEDFKIRSELVIGCDGRHSTVRRAAGLEIEDIGAPIDVLWFRLSRKPSDPIEPAGNFGNGRIFIMINRGDYWQCGYVIAKGSLAEVKKRGLQAFRADIEKLVPFLAGRSGEIGSLDEISLLTVGVDRLKKWHRPGLLCIGDAAHTMSPVGGIGINLAIQDAVAAANLLAEPLRSGEVSDGDLARVEARRSPPTRRTQWLQVLIQNNIIKAVLGDANTPKPPLLFRLIRRFPWLARIPARIIGLGFRPEHADLAVLDASRRSD
jgi:2-polyprenyl-6-methoxyphenol hydroxylase-like FAD-dependent oxidoreductase